ncbi:MAG: metallophosphoesterase [Coprobacillaceae bacterium]
MIFLIASVFIVYGLTNYYIGQNLILWSQHLFPSMNTNLLWIIYALLALTTVFTFTSSFMKIKKDTRIVQWLGRFGEFWMGVYFYSLLLWTISDLILFIGRLIHLIPYSNITQFITGSIVILITSIIVIYGMYNARQLKTTSYDININKPSTIDTLSVILISDLHFGYTNDLRYLNTLVTKINQLQPDIVLMAGDIINGDYNAIYKPDEMAALCRNIHSTYGTYACLGNHDAGNSYEEMITFFKDSNITLLNDAYTIIDNAFIIAGRVDSTPIGLQGNKRSTNIVLDGIDTTLPIIVMDHQPSNINQYDSTIDLILCGHTHKGQIFPFNLVTNKLFTVDYGYYRESPDSSQVIVSSGAATWGPPMRIGSHSEVVNINLSLNKKEK